MEDGAGANSSMIYIPLDQAHDVLDAFGEAYITSSSSSEDQNEEDEDEHLDLSTVMDFNIPNPMPNPSVMAISSILNQELEVDVDDIGTPYFWERDDRGGGVYSDGEEYQEIDDGSNVKPRYIFQDREVWQLRERGLLGDIRGEGGRGWGRVSRDVMHDTIYYAERERERERDRGRERGFRNWEDLPMELKLMVLDFCGDEECVSLARTSKDTRKLAKSMLEKRQEEFAKIPLVDISLATIKYLGYTDEKADELWSGWRWHAFLDERTFLGHCLTPMLFSELDDNGNIQTNYDVFDESDDWQAIMDGWGLNDEFQDKVMDERFKDLRLTESARYWTCKTVELRWSTLKHIQHASKQRVKPPMRLGDIRSSSTSAPAPWLQVPAESAPQRAQSEEGVTVLYKSIDVAKAYGIFPPSEGPYFGQTIESAPLRVEHGNILELIEGDRWSADFTCWANPLTMYPSRVLAEKFAAYSALRSYGHSPACLVKMSIPTKALRETLRIKDFSGEDGDEEWKQVVLINRKEDMVIPSLVSQMAIENVNLVVGKVSCNAGKAVVKMDEWEEMGAENVLMVDQGRGLKAAMQYAFLGEEWPFHLAESISVEKVEL